MGKVKYTLVTGKWTELPSGADEIKHLEVETEFDVKNGSPRLYLAYVEDVSNTSNKNKPNGYHIDQEFVILDVKFVENLVGKLLTYVDATFSDKKQREAHKDLIKQAVWSWYTDKQNITRGWTKTKASK